MSLVAFGVAGIATALTVRGGGAAPDELWPYFLAGFLPPGASQIFFTAAVAAAGPSRVSVVVGTAPLVAVAIALVFLDEPLEAGLVAGALLIVAGGGAPVRGRGGAARFPPVRAGLSPPGPGALPARGNRLPPRPRAARAAAPPAPA